MRHIKYQDMRKGLRIIGCRIRCIADCFRVFDLMRYPTKAAREIRVFHPHKI